MQKNLKVMLRSFGPTKQLLNLTRLGQLCSLETQHTNYPHCQKDGHLMAVQGIAVNSTRPPVPLFETTNDQFQYKTNLVRCRFR